MTFGKNVFVYVLELYEYLVESFDLLDISMENSYSDDSKHVNVVSIKVKYEKKNVTMYFYFSDKGLIIFNDYDCRYYILNRIDHVDYLFTHAQCHLLRIIEQIVVFS